MPSEEFDKKVKEAADNHHPTYDENAWAKMEKQLDKHLPQKKDDKRRYIFFLLLFLLTGGGAYLMITKPWQSNESSTVSDKKIAPDVSANTIKVEEDKNSEKTIPGNRDDINKAALPNENTKVQSQKQEISFVNTNSQIKKTKPALSINNTLLLQSDKKIIGPLKNNEVVQGNNKTETINNLPDNNNIVNPASEKTVANKSIDEQKVNTDISTDLTKDNTNVASTQPVKKTKTSNNNKRSNSFFLSLSAAPDVSFTAFNNMGKTKLLTGIGIGYSFKDKLTLRTGFYTGRKIYSAMPYQYHSPNSTWIPNYYLESINADCRVYEIPLLLSYNFSHSVRQSWLATMGLSSYLMKRETYDYQYKNSTGQLYSHQWTLNDEYKHYFSVLTLSGGYQRKINNTFSIMAEPYMKIPLSGIGFGKVKLNSAGVLISVGIKLSSSAKKTKTGD